MTARAMTLTAGLLGIIVGAIVSVVVSFRLPLTQVTRRGTLFCLFGSVVLTIAFILAISFYTLSPISTRDLLYAVPAAVVLFIAAADWLMQKPLLRVPVALLAIAVLVACGLADVQFLTAPKQDVALESKYVAPELVGDSCVVFVSERYSKSIFLVFQPELDSHECQEFFHHRIVLASHPDVHPDQQADAEGYFQGLNFHEVKRIRSGGGQIVVVEGK
jgi:hypothetical protein